MTLQKLRILPILISLPLLLMAPAPLRTGPTEALTTLYRFDPVLSSISLQTGELGARIVDGELQLLEADIAYGRPEGGLQAGLSEDRPAQILDMGTLQQLAQVYGYETPDGYSQFWASMRLDGDELEVAEVEIEDRYQEVTEYRSLLKLRPRVLDRTEVRAGHVYMIRITDRRDRRYELIAKLLILAHDPGERVTFRWSVLRP